MAIPTAKGPSGRVREQQRHHLALPERGAHRQPRQPQGAKDREAKTPILRDIAVTGDGKLWISGDQGILLRWDLVSQKWQQVSLQTDEMLRSISVKGSDAWIAGSKGGLWRLVAGSWVKQTVSPAPVSVFAVLAQDNQTVWLSGTRGTLLKCTPMDAKTVTCTDRRFTTTNLFALWGGSQGDLWAAGGVYLGDGKGRENNVGYIYHLLP